MKKIFILLSACIVIVSISDAQTVREQLSIKIAERMKDSLSLSTEQKNRIYSINLQLHTQKQNYRQQYSNADSLQYHIQRVESSRDSLYKSVLTSDQYLLYRQKKRNLINNN